MSRLDDLLELSDRELLSAHCAGDADAFGEIFRRHRDRMWAVALRTTRDPEMAADAPCGEWPRSGECVAAPKRRKRTTARGAAGGVPVLLACSGRRSTLTSGPGVLAWSERVWSTTQIRHDPGAGPVLPRSGCACFATYLRPRNAVTNNNPARMLLPGRGRGATRPMPTSAPSFYTRTLRLIRALPTQIGDTNVEPSSRYVEKYDNPDVQDHICRGPTAGSRTSSTAMGVRPCPVRDPQKER
jgi:hypothetical protein